MRRGAARGGATVGECPSSEPATGATRPPSLRGAAKQHARRHAACSPVVSAVSSVQGVRWLSAYRRLCDALAGLDRAATRDAYAQQTRRQTDWTPDSREGPRASGVRTRLIHSVSTQAGSAGKHCSAPRGAATGQSVWAGAQPVPRARRARSAQVGRAQHTTSTDAYTRPARPPRDEPRLEGPAHFRRNRGRRNGSSSSSSSGVEGRGPRAEYQCAAHGERALRLAQQALCALWWLEGPAERAERAPGTPRRLSRSTGPRAAPAAVGKQLLIRQLAAVGNLEADALGHEPISVRAEPTPTQPNHVTFTARSRHHAIVACPAP